MSDNLVDLFFARQEAWQSKPALEWNDREICNFAGLRLEVGRYRAALASLGVKPGDRVMVKAANSPAYVFTYLAVLASGAVFVPINPAYTAPEVALLIEDAKPVVLVHASDTAVPPPAAKLIQVTLEADSGGELPTLAAKLDPLLGIEPRASSDLAGILFTSGTTGRPKGAMLTHGNLSSNVEALFEIWRFSENDAILHCLPLFHVHGLFVCLHLGLYSGATIKLLPKFESKAVIGKLAEASVFMGVPTLYSRLLERPDFNHASCAAVRLFISGSAPLLPSVFAAFEARTGHRILERYGMTETAMITSNPYEQEGRIAGTVGYALPGVEVRVVDGERRELPPGEIGEIEMRGPNLCAGYWRRPEATAESHYTDGFFRTGDTAFLDETGRLTIAGRSKDLIISGGFNVYPAEIEILLAEVPGVLDVAVFGVPHPDFGEAVLAAVTTAGGQFDMATLNAAIAERLAKFKQPKAVHVLEEFPRNAMGKILKQELRQRYRDSFAS